MRTQVGIVGAGPAGLMLSHCLQQYGVESVVLEKHSREYVTRRVRAGVLEQGTVDLMHATGLGDRLHREGLVHRGIALQFEGQRHRIALSDLTGGRAITIYSQQKVVEDVIDARLASGGPLHFDVQDVRVRGIETDTPSIAFVSASGEEVNLVCDYIAGCDGFHGICRDAIPADVLRVYARAYPFAWLGILAAVAPSAEELIYAYHPRGFALHSLRSPEISRLYLQCDPDDHVDDWPDARIWEELHCRFETRDGWTLAEGPILEKGITPMRSFAVEPMQYGRLFLVGDAAHIVPPTGAKGLNLAIADARTLARALGEWYRTATAAHLAAYSATCLQRLWKVQHFSTWMTSMLHKHPDDAFQDRIQLGLLHYLSGSVAAQTSLAESYVGLAGDL